MRILVLGCGLMGRAIAFDLARFGGVHTLGVADVNEENLSVATSALKGRQCFTHKIDCTDRNTTAQLFMQYDIVISSVPYRLNDMLTQIAIDTHTHFLDLGGNNDVVRSQKALHERAKAAGVLVVPNCGLAPGLSNILAMTGFRKFDDAHSVHAYVGGLPQNPKPPLFYQLVFSVEGLLNEYTEPAEIIAEGRCRIVESMTGLESISFGNEFSELEAFYTSGGLSLLPQLLEGKVKSLSYKTIRYRGHCEKFKTLLDVGCAEAEPITIGGCLHTTRELFAGLLRKQLSGSDEDVVLFRVDVTGVRSGNPQTLRYEMIDRYDSATGMTAMMRTTGYPTSVTALLIAEQKIKHRGVFVPEEIVDGNSMIDELSSRHICISTDVLQAVAD